MWEIWAIQLLPKALKCGPKSNKSPNLVTLVVRTDHLLYCHYQKRNFLVGRIKYIRDFTDEQVNNGKVNYDSRVIIYERKMCIRLATDWLLRHLTRFYQSKCSS